MVCSKAIGRYSMLIILSVAIMDILEHASDPMPPSHRD